MLASFHIYVLKSQIPIQRLRGVTWVSNEALSVESQDRDPCLPCVWRTPDQTQGLMHTRQALSSLRHQDCVSVEEILEISVSSCCVRILHQKQPCGISVLVLSRFSPKVTVFDRASQRKVINLYNI